MQNTRINNLQVLRAFAAISVAYYHTDYLIPGLHLIGSFGVDVFFVISGFIMAKLARTEPFLIFLRRRAARIVPLYWSATLTVFAIACYAPNLVRATRPDGTELLKSLFFIPFEKSNGELRPVLFLGWTLNYEMFFYASIAIGLLLWKRSAILVACGLLLILPVFEHAFHFSGYSVFARFYGDPITLEFVAGVAACYLAENITRGLAFSMRRFTAAAAVVSTAALIVLQALGAGPHVSRAITLGPAAFFLVLSTALLSRAGIDTKLKSAILVGDASYMLYLIHPYIESAVLKLTSKHLTMLNARHGLLGVAFTLIVTVILSVLAHIHLERPFLNAIRERRSTGKGTRHAAVSLNLSGAPPALCAEKIE